MNQLTPVIANITIRQDKQGRFNLVDLHKASGGASRHSPSYWLRNQQTQEFITELRNSLILSDSGNPETDKVHIEPVNIVKSFFMDQGTYVVEELVYPYAMWVSPTFHLQVIRAYAALVKGRQPAPQATPAAPASVEARLDRLESVMTTMATHMGTLAEVSVQQAQKLEVTARYIGLLEINQKGKIKVTRAIEAQVLALRAQGMSMGDIARTLRISTTAVSLLINGKYPLSASQTALPRESVEEALETLVEAERSALLSRLAQLDGEQ